MPGRTTVKQVEEKNREAASFLAVILAVWPLQVGEKKLSGEGGVS